MRAKIHYWRRDDFDAIQQVEAKARAFPEWEGYAQFCSALHKGLRKQAFEALEIFISRLDSGSFADRRLFVSWLLHQVDYLGNRSPLVPHPLRARVIDPTLTQWVAAEPENGEPHRWLGGQDHWRRALEIDPADQIARRKLVISILAGVDYATHEMPRGYLGNPESDWRALAEAERISAGLADEDIRQELLSDIAEQRKLVEAAW